ncbi:MAG: VOC family protein, partial [Solirubrobacteraceae bacterium]
MPREPRDICFGTYAGNQAPMDGDIGCQVGGRAPLALVLGENFIPRSAPVARFITVYGQADRDVAHLELLGPGGRRLSLPFSAHRLFLAAFSPSVRGTVQLRAQLADGTTFTHKFTLPLTRNELGAWPRLRRRGAVFDYEVGENITTESYRTIRQRFGAPLKTFRKPGNARCAYYDTVGYPTGWVFCFRGEKMLSAAGNQNPPPGPSSARVRRIHGPLLSRLPLAECHRSSEHDTGGTAMLEKVFYTSVLVSDQDKALDFYTNVLGLEKRVENPTPDGPRFLTVGVNGDDFQLVLWPGTPGQAERAMGRPPASITIETDDCHKTAEELKSRGVEFI